MLLSLTINNAGTVNALFNSMVMAALLFAGALLFVVPAQAENGKAGCMLLSRTIEGLVSDTLHPEYFTVPLFQEYRVERWAE